MVLRAPAKLNRIASGLVLTATLATIAGCGLEAPDETSKEHVSIQAASNHIGAIDIRDAYIVNSSDANGTLHPYLLVTLVNNSTQADSLTGITTSIGAVSLDNADAATGGVTVPPRTRNLLEFSDPQIDATDPTATIDTSTEPKVGTTVNVGFTFANAGQIKAFAVPVVDNNFSLSPTAPVGTEIATPPAEDAPGASD